MVLKGFRTGGGRWPRLYSGEAGGPAEVWAVSWWVRRLLTGPKTPSSKEPQSSIRFAATSEKMGSRVCSILELERVFHTSRNGRHLCQVFPETPSPAPEYLDVPVDLGRLLQSTYQERSNAGPAASLLQNLRATDGAPLFRLIPIRRGITGLLLAHQALWPTQTWKMFVVPDVESRIRWPISLETTKVISMESHSVQGAQLNWTRTG